MNKLLDWLSDWLIVLAALLGRYKSIRFSMNWQEIETENGEKKIIIFPNQDAWTTNHGE